MDTQNLPCPPTRRTLPILQSGPTARPEGALPFPGKPSQPSYPLPCPLARLHLLAGGSTAKEFWGLVAQPRPGAAENALLPGLGQADGPGAALASELARSPRAGIWDCSCLHLTQGEDRRPRGHLQQPPSPP